MIQVGEPFDEVQAQELKDIADAYAPLDIGAVVQGKGGRNSVGRGKLIEVGVEIGVVLPAHPPKQHHGGDHIPQVHFLQQGNTVVKHDSVISIVPQVIGVQLQGIGLVGPVSGQ